jgi:exopolysaccharide biosynthesis polyprenyl glycosylphosphotransferase
MGIEDFLGIPMMTVSMTSSKVGQLLLKEFLDFCGAAILLLLLSPLFLVIAVAIKMTSPGPLFYRWKVSGLNGREFTGYKFRTMVVNADELKPALLAQNERTGPVFKMTRDPRITPVGRVLRKFSLDELPQVWSVLKGDMSLVGPRPPLQTETERFAYWQRRKLSVKPGVTGLWQVNGRGSVQDFNEWVQMDLEYIDNWSLWLDLKLLLKTIPAILRGTGV